MASNERDKPASIKGALCADELAELDTFRVTAQAPARGKGEGSEQVLSPRQQLNLLDEKIKSGLAANRSAKGSGGKHGEAGEIQNGLRTAATLRDEILKDIARREARADEPHVETGESE